MSDVVLDEFIIFSDHHAHPFSYGAKETLVDTWDGESILHNSRLAAAYQVLKEINEYAFERGIRRIFFGGDMFHVREAVSTDAMNLMLDGVAQLAQGHREIHMIPGNHDYFDREGQVHSLKMFKHIPNVTVYDSDVSSRLLHTARGDSYRVCFVPYTEDRKKAVAAIQSHALTGKHPRILLAHLGMQGATVGSDYVLVSDGDLTVDDVPSDAFLGCFFGHYHQHQVLFKNGWFIGASHHHNWGDVNTRRGFLHVKVHTDHVSFDFVETRAPRFIAVKAEDIETAGIRSTDFVKVITEKKMTDKQINDMRKLTGTDNTEVIYVPPDIQRAAVELSDKHFSADAMVDVWVKANEEWIRTHLPDVASDDLMAYGRTILATIQEKT